jgi:5-oxoprolinase (ATP-hydrolysing)
MKGYDAAAHVLACFGGAGGQHACAIASALGMSTIFVHRWGALGFGLRPCLVLCTAAAPWPV